MTKNDTRKGAVAPPPPTTRSGSHEDRPKIGVPYVPPALIIRDRGEPEVVEVVEVVEVAAPRDNKTHGLARPAGLPPPGTRRPPAEPAAAIRLPDPTKIPIPLESADSGPPEIAPQDTASLINALTTEIIDDGDVEAPAPVAPVIQPDKRRKLALYFVIGAALLSLIVALLPSNDAEPEPDAPTPSANEEERPEPPALIEPPKQEPAPSSEPANEPEPEPANEPAPANEPGSELSGPLDKRSSEELFTAAKAAFNSGRSAEAYRLAFISWRRKKSSETAELLTRAACKMKDAVKASASLAKVAAGQRGAIKEECAAMGLEL